MISYIVGFKPRRIILRDTRGNYSLGIKLSNEERLERNRQRVKQWFKDNPSEYRRHLEYVRNWRRKNKQKSLEYNQKWRDSHREQYKAQQREYYHNNKDKPGFKERWNQLHIHSYYKNRERILKREKEKYWNNPEEARRIQREQYKNRQRKKLESVINTDKGKGKNA